jgi:nephrocystin-3
MITNYQNKITNRSIRIFVSSTFRDMMEERNVLMTHTWPELLRFCRERQVELVEVDLRWGITEEQSTRNETLKLCLDEIRACRPYFIGLLGERYGSILGDDAFTADLEEEQPWLKDLHGKSVTELEILHGVLNNPEMAGRSFFYFRDPKYIESISNERRIDFLSENSASDEKQTTLKNLIRTTCKLNNIPLFETYPDPQSLASLILDNLKNAIDKQFPKESIPDPLTREEHDHEAFAEIRRRTYIGRQHYFETLDNHCKSDGMPLLLLGDSGSGKSALIANWVEHWRKGHPDDFIFQHYIGGTGDSSVHWKLMTRLMAEIKRWCSDNQELPRTNDDILKDFPVWLTKARNKAKHAGIRIIIILDALNQLEEKDHAQTLGWLPAEPFTGNLRLIVSTLPGNTYVALEKRTLPVLKIEPLTPAERGRMISDYLKRFGKSLDKPQIERLSNAKAASNPLYLKILLDELRVTGIYKKLDKRLDDYLNAEDIPSLLRIVLARYESDYEQDRKGLVCEALGLIWSARRGLSENELLQLLRPDNLPQLPLAIWSPLRAVLEESLIDQGGILNFAHDFLRTAVETAFVKDLDKKDDFKIQLADYFEALPTIERKCDELPWLLLQTELFERLRTCLLNIDCFLEIQKRDEEELRGYWVDLGEEKNMGQSYLNSFNEWKEVNDDEKISYGANQLGFFLYSASLHTEAEPLYRLSLNVLEYTFGKDHPSVALILNNLAQLFQDTNRFSEAEPLLKRALEINEDCLGKDHPNVAIGLNNLAQLLKDTNRMDEAETLYLRALKIEEDNYGKDHSQVAIILNNIASLLEKTNRMDEAETLYLRALKIQESNYGKDHSKVTMILNNIASLLRQTNRMIEAEPLMRRVLKIYEENFGKDHPNVAISLNNLAQLFQATNRFGDAETLMRRALKIDEDCFGKYHINVARDLNNLAGLLQNTNRLNEAEPIFLNALNIYEEIFGKNHVNVAICLNNLANLLNETNRKSEAEPLYRRALKINEDNFGKDHPNVAASLSCLAGLLRDTNRMSEAEPLMRRAIKINEDSLGIDHPKVATSLSHLGTLLHATNRMSEAEPLMRRTLKIDEDSLGEDHPDVARDLNNLAQLLKDTNRMSEAEPLMRRALKISEESFGNDHQYVALSLNNLAQLLQATKRMNEAEPLMRRAIKINEDSLGIDHPRVATSLSHLAHLLHATNRMSEAEPVYRRTLKILEESFGKDHPIVAIELNNFAALLQSTYRISQAEPLIRRSISILEKTLGENHPNVAICLNTLVQLLQDTNRMGEAEPLSRRVVEIFINFPCTTGYPNPHLESAVNNYAGLLKDMGWNEEQIRDQLKKMGLNI